MHEIGRDTLSSRRCVGLAPPKQYQSNPTDFQDLYKPVAVNLDHSNKLCQDPRMHQNINCPSDEREARDNML